MLPRSTIAWIFRGLTLYAVDRGEITSLMAGMLGAMAQAFVDDLRHKTKRGQMGKILAGLAAGGLGYGYEVDPAVKGGRNIVADEAAVVRRIFELYANGASPRSIVTKLNAERVAGPGGRPWGDTTVRGQVDRGTGILNNAAYVGCLEWNRCSYVRNPSTGKRVARPNPPEQWEVMDAPELRIVGDDLWNRAKARQDEVRTVMARDESGQALNRAHRAKHLLSGLIFCGQCGAPFAMRDVRHYGCRNFRSRGTCANDTLVDRYDLERAVAEGIRHKWLTVVNIEALRAQLSAKYVEEMAGAGEARAKLVAKAARIEGQMARVVSAIADAGHSAPLIAKLADLEAEAKRLALEIQEADKIVAPLALSTAEVEQMVKNFGDQLQGRVLNR